MSWFRRNFSMLLKSFLKGGFIVAPPVIMFNDVGWTIRTVDGVSMKPTLNPDDANTDFVLLNKWAASSMSFERGEVVSLVSPKDPDQWLIKRVVAIEGDQVKDSYFGEKQIVPPGHVWVEGDNPDNSYDSNKFGPVSTGLITGKATHIIFPPERYQKLEVENLVGDRVTPRETVNRGQVFFGWDVS